MSVHGFARAARALPRYWLIRRAAEDITSGRRSLAADQAYVANGFGDKLRRVLGRVPFVEDLVAARYCATDPATPLGMKAALMGALAYFVMPADIVPDVIVGLGFLDDATVLSATLSMVDRHLKPGHRERALKALGFETRPRDTA